MAIHPAVLPLSVLGHDVVLRVAVGSDAVIAACIDLPARIAASTPGERTRTGRPEGAPAGAGRAARP
ncbi:hypothetical protein ABZ721_31310 [Streptomyces sp. NPDC006733]|uniref:hypothetical protein n=1 Tax=Streptomyces sp. NPDC006733 TaxID=3155460 RepID=UPI0033E4B4C8